MEWKCLTMHLTWERNSCWKEFKLVMSTMQLFYWKHWLEEYFSKDRKQRLKLFQWESSYPTQTSTTHIHNHMEKKNLVLLINQLQTNIYHWAPALCSQKQHDEFGVGTVPATTRFVILKKPLLLWTVFLLVNWGICLDNLKPLQIFKFCNTPIGIKPSWPMFLPLILQAVLVSQNEQRVYLAKKGWESGRQAQNLAYFLCARHDPKHFSKLVSHIYFCLLQNPMRL